MPPNTTAELLQAMRETRESLNKYIEGANAQLNKVGIDVALVAQRVDFICNHQQEINLDIAEEIKTAKEDRKAIRKETAESLASINKRLDSIDQWRWKLTIYLTLAAGAGSILAQIFWPELASFLRR